MGNSFEAAVPQCYHGATIDIEGLHSISFVAKVNSSEYQVSMNSDDLCFFRGQMKCKMFVSCVYIYPNLVKLGI